MEEEAEKAAALVYHTARDVPVASSSLLRKLNKELHITLPLLGRHDQSPLPNSKFFPNVTLPVTSPRSSLSNKSDGPEIKPRERNSNSVRLWPCDECGKVFKKERAMYGHKRSHSHKITQIQKSPEQQTAASAICHQELSTDHDHHHESRTRKRRLKSQSSESSSSSCGAKIKKGGWDVQLDVNISVEELASFLVDLSHSDGKTHVCEKCDRRFPSERTLREHHAALKPLSTDRLKKSGEKRQKRIKKECKSKKLHVCIKCGREFSAGHKLGGHMRAHYDPAEPKRKSGSGV